MDTQSHGFMKAATCYFRKMKGMADVTILVQIIKDMSVSEIAEKLKSIKIAKSYKEKAKDLKRLAIAVAASFSLLLSLSAAFIAIADGSGIPMQDEKDLVMQMNLMDGIKWKCSKSDRKAFSDSFGISFDGTISTESSERGMLAVEFCSDSSPSVAIFMVRDGFISSYIGKNKAVLYLKEGKTRMEDLILIEIGNVSAIFQRA